MPTLDLSNLNIVLGALGICLVLYGLVSVKIKLVWYLGVALPAVVTGIVLGPAGANLMNSSRWGGAQDDQTSDMTLGITRIMIGIQLVVAGFQLPAQYLRSHWRSISLCVLPVMTAMWLSTTACVLLVTPNLSFRAALVVAACVSCTDPVLAPAVARGPFADMFVARELRDLMACEAGVNDGFGFPFLMFAVYLMRYAGGEEGVDVLGERAGGGGGGVAVALREWFLETWLYMMVLSVCYGVLVGFAACKGIRFCLERKWIDTESYLLFPLALALALVGTCGALGTDDSLACFVAGAALNWDGHYLSRSSRLGSDALNANLATLVNFAGFLHIGTVLPWAAFHDPSGTGVTLPRLLLLGVSVLVFRRMPAVLAAHGLTGGKRQSRWGGMACGGWRDALFMGYFGPVGAGAVFYAEYARRLFPPAGAVDGEEARLLQVLGPVVHWLVLFSVVVHGLSMPALDWAYRYCKVEPVRDDDDGDGEVWSERDVDGSTSRRVVLGRFRWPGEDVELARVGCGLSADGPGEKRERRRATIQVIV